MKPAEEMTDEELRIVIAEWCGWAAIKQQVYYENELVDTPGGTLYGVDLLTSFRCEVPNYPADLNAIAEALAKLVEHWQRYEWTRHMRQLVVDNATPHQKHPDFGHPEDFYFYNADARTRAVALVKTIHSTTAGEKS